MTRPFTMHICIIIGRWHEQPIRSAEECRRMCRLGRVIAYSATDELSSDGAGFDDATQYLQAEHGEDRRR